MLKIRNPNILYQSSRYRSSSGCSLIVLMNSDHVLPPVNILVPGTMGISPAVPKKRTYSAKNRMIFFGKTKRITPRQQNISSKTADKIKGNHSIITLSSHRVVALLCVWSGNGQGVVNIETKRRQPSVTETTVHLRSWKWC